ncbi:hypothetical protein B0H17DRAFT_1207760 [Mycena rosella]|uniref:Uncharacterized protein n=1 Tax=Mycena rosella TaxID=1033263 RepID=A0AAD7G7J1_MYCRO|nr:hypothetical protein B0H17DRAFT_1207760 [Mycena rosella]
MSCSSCLSRKVKCSLNADFFFHNTKADFFPLRLDFDSAFAALRPRRPRGITLVPASQDSPPACPSSHSKPLITASAAGPSLDPRPPPYVLPSSTASASRRSSSISSYVPLDGTVASVADSAEHIVLFDPASESCSIPTPPSLPHVSALPSLSSGAEPAVNIVSGAPPTMFSHHTLLAILSALDSSSLISVITQLSDCLTALGVSETYKILNISFLQIFHIIAIMPLSVLILSWASRCTSSAALDVRNALATLAGQFDGCRVAHPQAFALQKDRSEGIV